MTKKERATVQNFINKLTELDNIQEETLKTLQDMNVEHGDGSRYCSWQLNLLGVLGSTNADERTKDVARYHYKRYVEAHAQEKLIQEFGGELAEVGFWK